MIVLYTIVHFEMQGIFFETKNQSPPNFVETKQDLRSEIFIAGDHLILTSSTEELALLL